MPDSVTGARTGLYTGGWEAGTPTSVYQGGIYTGWYTRHGTQGGIWPGIHTGRHMAWYTHPGRHIHTQGGGDTHYKRYIGRHITRERGTSAQRGLSDPKKREGMRRKEASQTLRRRRE